MSYAAADEVELCPGTVSHAEQWMEAVAEKIGVDTTQLLPTTYYFVDDEVLSAECPGDVAGCAWRDGQEILLFASELLLKHELVHSLRLSAWPQRSPLLEEGLAHGFADEFPLTSFAPSTDALNAAIEETSFTDINEVVVIGGFLVTWIVRRYGAEGFSQLWHGASNPTNAMEFRADFERELGEPLDTMLAEIGDIGCPLVTCVSELRPWEAGRWTTSSPDGCGESTIGAVGPEHYWVRRAELMRIDVGGDYEIAVSDESPRGTVITPCDAACQFAEPIPVEHGETVQHYLPAGRYRVETAQTAADEPTYTVEIRPVN